MDEMQVDNEWFEAIAGRSDRRFSAATVAEAALFRAAMLAWQPVVASSPTPDPGRIEELIRKARIAGVLAPRQRPPMLRWLDETVCRTNGRSARQWMLAVASCAAVAVAVGGIVDLLQPPRDAPSVERATKDAPTVLRAADPLALKLRLSADLAAAGVKCHGYRRLGRYGIDADINPMPPTQQVLRVLQTYGLSVPTDGVLRVEFEAPPP